MEQDCHKAGLFTAEDIRALGPDATYLKLLRSGTRPHFIGYYALVMGLQGRPWTDCQGKEKDDLRQRFDRLCRDALKDAPSSQFAQDLDRLGVRLDQPTNSKPEKK